MNRTQTATRAAMVQATSSDDANCSVIRGASFVANVPQSLAHGLTDNTGKPRAWVSYRVENVQGGFPRFQAAHVSTALDATSISVTADANCTADVRAW